MEKTTTNRLINLILLGFATLLVLFAGRDFLREKETNTGQKDTEMHPQKEEDVKAKPAQAEAETNDWKNKEKPLIREIISDRKRIKKTIREKSYTEPEEEEQNIYFDQDPSNPEEREEQASPHQKSFEFEFDPSEFLENEEQ